MRFLLDPNEQSISKHRWAVRKYYRLNLLTMLERKPTMCAKYVQKMNGFDFEYTKYRRLD
jgi:hypothetical protein